jgi:tRNA(Met) C34 N-acetyltransferase TmcA
VRSDVVRGPARRRAGASLMPAMRGVPRPRPARYRRARRDSAVDARQPSVCSTAGRGAGRARVARSGSVAYAVRSSSAARRRGRGRGKPAVVGCAVRAGDGGGVLRD